MYTTEPGQFLAHITDEAAQVWQAFAESNNVSVDRLLEALGPILLNGQSSEQSFSDALTKAVEVARYSEPTLAS